MPEMSQVNDIYQCRVRAYFGGIQCNNILHFKTTVASADVELELIQALLACFVDELLPGLSTMYIMSDINWKRVHPTLGPEHIYQAPASTAGAVTGDVLPTFCAAVLSIRSNEGGRSKRGRMYLAGLPESGCFANSITVGGATWTALLAFAACLVEKFIDLESIGTGKFHLGVYSRKIGGSSFPYGAAGFTPALSVTPVGFIATMRSRKQGHGP